MDRDSLHERLLRARERARVIDLREFADFTQEALRKSAPVALGVVVGRVISRCVESYVDALVAPTVSVMLRLVRSRARVEEFTVTILGVPYPIGVAIDATLDALATILVIFLALKCVARGWPATKPCADCKSWLAVDATKCAHCQSDVSDVSVVERGAHAARASDRARLSDDEDDIDGVDGDASRPRLR